MRTRRVTVLAAVVGLSVVVLAALALTAGGGAAQGSLDGGNETDRYGGQTLVTVQAYGWFGNHNGEAFIVDESGERVWSYQPPNAAVFDGEVLDDGNVMVSYGQAVPRAECPEDVRDGDTCIHNRVQEVDPETNEVVWEYDWWDHMVSYHEVHDADRLPNGETVIIDMGNHRTFTVDQSGNVTWEWSAIEHLDEGTPFWREHVAGTSRAEDPGPYEGTYQDWTHMNDVDRLPNGNFLMSIRNFDVVIEVDPETDDIVDVFGDPGDHSVLHEQHDPMYLPSSGNLLVADSENDRIVEYDRSTGAEVWRYEGPRAGDALAWPRDADRLPNGHTMVADSRGFRALEVDEDGDVVWRLDLTDVRGIVYDVDRLGPDRNLPEEPTNATAGRDLSGTEYGDSVLTTADSWLAFVFPPWVGVEGALAILTGLVAALGLVREGVRDWRA